MQFRPLLTHIATPYIIASEHLALNGLDYEVFAYLGKEVILNCSVDSQSPIEGLEEVTWKRTDQDILVLLYQDGEVQPDSTDERYQGRAEFFTTDILKGIFSLRLKDFRNEDIGEYVCEVHTSNLSGKRTVILKVIGKLCTVGFREIVAWVLVYGRIVSTLFTLIFFHNRVLLHSDYGFTAVSCCLAVFFWTLCSAMQKKR